MSIKERIFIINNINNQIIKPKENPNNRVILDIVYLDLWNRILVIMMAIKNDVVEKYQIC